MSIYLKALFSSIVLETTRWHGYKGKEMDPQPLQ